MIYYVFVFIFGVVFSSFIEAYAVRLLRGKSIITPRSHCDRCKHQLSWYELIPLLSYIFLRGKCKYCKSKIGIASFLGELIIGILFVVAFYIFGFSYETFMCFVLILVTESIIITDFKEMIILDSTIIGGIVLITIITIFQGGFSGLYQSFMSGVFAFTLMFLIKILGDAVFKRESLGGGDIKLAFLMGLVLTPKLYLLNLVLASTLALPYAAIVGVTKKTNELSFGPFLIISTLIIYIFNVQITEFINLLFMI